jgi:hypothetical protein
LNEILPQAKSTKSAIAARRTFAVISHPDAGKTTLTEKLLLYAGPDRPVTVDDVPALVPDARATTIFALVAALGRRDRARALETLEHAFAVWSGLRVVEAAARS